MPYGKVVNITKICYRVTETIIVISATRRNSNYRNAKYAGRTVPGTDITTTTGKTGICTQYHVAETRQSINRKKGVMRILTLKNCRRLTRTSR